MRAVVQRVAKAKVEVKGKIIGQINEGLLIYIGVGRNDDLQDIEYLTDKITNLRIFEDESGKMNYSLKETKGEALIISQFTLYGDCRKGRRPGFSDAAPPENSEELINLFIEKVREKGIRVQTGIFGSHMLVDSLNDGPVTMLIDSSKLF